MTKLRAIPEIKNFMDKKDIVEMAHTQAITIVRWAKSCETPEQMENVVNFVKDHPWTMNEPTKDKVNYWKGVCYGAVVVYSKTKFK